MPIQSVISDDKTISLLFPFLPTLNSSLQPKTTKIGCPSQNALNELPFYQLCHPRKCKKIDFITFTMLTKLIKSDRSVN